MNEPASRSPGGGMDGRRHGHQRGDAPGETPGRAATLYDNVLAPELQAIVAGLAGRTRYRYVQPLVLPEGRGWKIVSPNCSRQVDPEGGLIDIAWLLPLGGRWQLFAREHRRQQWLLQAQDLSLTEAVDRVCQDPLGLYWP